MVYNPNMTEAVKYPIGIPYRNPRPRGNSLAAAIGALLGYATTGGLGGAVVGGMAGNELAKQPSSLESAIRTYFEQQKIPMVSFYRHGSKMVKVLFNYRNGYWLITSRAPQHPEWTAESLDDWLYGDITEFQLPDAKAEIDSRFIA